MIFMDPLNKCIKNKEIDYDYIYLEHGVNVNIQYRDQYGNLCTPLILYIACYYSNESIIKILIECEVYVNVELIQMKWGYFFTPISIVCYKGSNFIARYLINHGANVNGNDYINDNGNDINNNNNNDNDNVNNNDENNSNNNPISPILIACENKKESIVKALIEHGANVNVMYNHNTPLSIVREKNNESMSAIVNFK
ncbi:hypothetical protein PIROE2DRAFT_6144 [Piromyces sp. E2]|nr:hypothetical protein PIROE2DRAFT_6144 [Piromyces sp. E2]|eukprot:OUM66613.1 hypothetical protein PIROE2DRAFT_6144 [Piromyces sp. E2]